MALQPKPDMKFIWASGGAVVQPSDVKVQTGWTPEVPPHQWENWLQNRQDQYLAHINQRGIPAWDGLTSYEAGGLSYVQGSDGKVYKSVAASGPAGVVSNPTTDGTDTYWTEAFSPIVSPAFSGNPTAPTAAQFDNDTSIATTEFVQRAIGNYQGVVTIAASGALSVADAGKVHLFSSAPSSFNVTLPAVSGLPMGTAYHFHNNINYSQTLTGSGSDVIASGQLSIAATYVIPPGCSATLTKNSTNGWMVSAGTSNLDQAGIFASSLAANGYQKLPSGYIEQWGYAVSLGASETRTITLPISFPAGTKSIVISGNGANPAVRIAALGASTIQIQNVGTTGQNAYWRAVGY